MFFSHRAAPRLLPIAAVVAGSGVALSSLEANVAAASLGVLLPLIAFGALWLTTRRVAADVADVEASVAARTAISPSLGALSRAIEAYSARLTTWSRERTAAREGAEETARYENEFLTTLSHELRTPLNSVLGFTQVLLDHIDGPLTEGQRENLVAIATSGEHLKQLVDDVIDLATLSTHRGSLIRSWVDVRAVLTEVGHLLQPLAPPSVSIEVTVPESLPRVLADPKRLRQIVWNLSGNAVKFTTRGWVRIAASVEGNSVRIRVEDTGAGIPKAQIAAIFEDFVQVEGAPARSQGTGLGLSIVKRLVALHGGTIEVESEKGRGSRFDVLLPIESRS